LKVNPEELLIENEEEIAEKFEKFKKYYEKYFLNFE
jgi:hypothetical protein